VERLLRLDWSPKQASGFLRAERILAISHEAIYVHVWHDKTCGGDLWKHMRQAGKKRRKRHGRYDSQGKLAGKRHISERPPEVENRIETGHWEIDTVMDTEHGRNSVLTLVERATAYTVIGKLDRHCAAEATGRCVELVHRHPGVSTPSPPTTVRSSTATKRLKPPPEPTSTSRPRTTRGIATPTRTRTS